MGSSGGHAQFGVRFVRFQDRIFAFMATVLPNRDDAEEVFQQISLVLWQKWRELGPSRDFVRWACGMAHHKVRRDGETEAGHSPAWRGLAVAVLHVLVLACLLAPGLAAQPVCKYVHLLDEVTAATSARQCQLAALVPPATMGHVEQIAGNLEKMPPKSMYFYPKLLSGLLFNSLRTS
jgi:hypothetical protein